MSRIDDDRQAARTAERLALQKREAELKNKEKVQADSAFSKLVGKSVQEKQVQSQKQASTAQSAIARLKAEMGEAGAEATHFDAAMGEAAAKTDEGARSANNSARSKLGDKLVGEKFKNDQATGQETSTAGRMGDEASAGMAAKGRNDEGMSGARAGQGRVSDAKRNNESLEEKGASDVSQGGKAMGGKGELKADGESGKGSGGQQKDGQSKDGAAGGAPAGFRFNPALMAPVPVAQKRDMAGSDRLRRIANEIAQKIVEKVRVGKNAAGATEFQIDLRTNVLKGLSIKVQSHNGRISMIFSGHDKDTLKYIEEQAQGLKESLTSRGLKLQDLKFETIK
jgi:hypothetical protein